MLAGKEASRLIESTDDPESVQREILVDRTLAPNADTEYGRRHGFGSIATFDAFRARVPLVDYEDIRSSVDRMAVGERDVLTAERVVSFFKTSGSTADPKLIPVTPSLMRDKGRAFGIYWHLVNSSHPSLVGGRLIANFGDAGRPEKTSAGVEVISETSFWNRRMQMFQRQSGWPLPPVVRQIRDPDLRFFAVARLAMQGKLHGIMCLNPSTLLKLCRAVEDHAPALVSGLAEGGLGYPGSVGPDDAARLAPHLERQEDRAATLQRDVLGRNTIELTRIWPELSVALCWQSEMVQPYLKQVRSYMPSVVFRDYITQSSECIMAIPLADATSGGLLAYTSHFFEFIPISRIDEPNPDTLLAWELEAGERYELVVTTSGGLYRYRMGDCVEVTGVRGRVPMLTFLYRTGKTSSITGEKLTEQQVLEAARRASEALSIAPLEYLCFPRTGRDPHYGVLLHWPDETANGDGDHDTLGRWVRRFDDELKRVNGEYQDKRASGRLGDPVAVLTGPDGFEAYRQQMVRRNVSEDQVKMGVLSRTLDLDASLPTGREVHASRSV